MEKYMVDVKNSNSHQSADSASYEKTDFSQRSNEYLQKVGMFRSIPEIAPED